MSVAVDIMVGMTVPATSTTRERLIGAAARMTAERGWAAVTMAGLAGDVGVSRQTVYNEIGSKPRLAEAMVLWELGHFLEAVNAGFDAHPNDLGDAAEAACRNVFERAASSPLLRAVASASHGADTELLPLLTTHSESLLAAAHAAVTMRLEDYDHGLDVARLPVLVDAIVRFVLSNVMLPHGTPEQMAESIGWIVRRVQRP